MARISKRTGSCPASSAKPANAPSSAVLPTPPGPWMNSTLNGTGKRFHRPTVADVTMTPTVQLNSRLSLTMAHRRAGPRTRSSCSRGAQRQPNQPTRQAELDPRRRFRRYCKTLAIVASRELAGTATRACSGRGAAAGGPPRRAAAQAGEAGATPRAMSARPHTLRRFSVPILPGPRPGGRAAARARRRRWEADDHL